MATTFRHFEVIPPPFDAVQLVAVEDVSTCRVATIVSNDAVRTKSGPQDHSIWGLAARPVARQDEADLALRGCAQGSGVTSRDPAGWDAARTVVARCQGEPESDRWSWS
jgi:hypothetical protein